MAELRVPWVIPEGKFAGAHIVEMESADLVHLARGGIRHRPELVAAIALELKRRRNQGTRDRPRRRLIRRP